MNIPVKPDSGGIKPSAAEHSLTRATALSRFLRHLLEADRQLRAETLGGLDQKFDAGEMESFLARAPVEDERGLSVVLRRLRKHVMARLIARDLGGMADLAEVMATASDLAEVAIRFACARLSEWLKRQYGSPIGAESGTPQDLLVIGMGKLGGRELNVSSDVDLIFVYPEEGETDAAHALSNHEFFTRLARKLILSLNDFTAEGYVFRVDMRLRPHGESGALACSFSMLENYFITQGRQWERYAWIKGRRICGPRAKELDRLVRPFVFRKYLDFGAYASMRAMHGQIRQEVRRRDMHDNIKLGPGGIREIEFIAQVFQLIRGGRDPALRARPTLTVLERLAERRLLPAPAVAELAAAYEFLRNLEHRLQYLDDRQTQALPKTSADREIVAAAMGFPSYDEFMAWLNHHRGAVARHFDAVFAASRNGPAQNDLAPLWQDEINREEAATRLGALGYARPEEICERLTQIRQGNRYRQLSESSRERFDALVPVVIKTAAGFANSDETLERMFKLLESVGRRASYLALLLEFPQALERVARLAAASRWASEYLTQHPILLDELLEVRELHADPDWTQFTHELRVHLDDAHGDIERQMDVLRHFHHAKVFQLVAKDLEGLLPLETLSDHLSNLADMILAEVLRLAWDGLRQRHRGEPRFAIIGYGKLGGKELGYASDLDIIFLYDDPDPEAPENYAKLGQRINTWLTSYTPAGVLYETDLRLRPNGSSGLLVSSLQAFELYQRSQAWVWEHQALTRGRFVAGDAAIGREFERIRKEVLCRRRDLGPLRTEILAMRRRMLDGHPNPTQLFDLKHDRGGIVDVEFMVQFLVLGYAHAHPQLIGNIGNLALLKLSAQLGLIPVSLAEDARNGYREFRRLQHQLRLSGEKFARIEASRLASARMAVLELWKTVFGE